MKIVLVTFMILTFSLTLMLETTFAFYVFTGGHSTMAFAGGTSTAILASLAYLSLLSDSIAKLAVAVVARLLTYG